MKFNQVAVACFVALAMKDESSMAFVHPFHSTSSIRRTSALNIINPDDPNPRRTTPDESADAYAQWCFQFGKKYDPNRVHIFQENLQQMQAYKRKTGLDMKLNEYSDLTTEEYQERMGLDTPLPSPQLNENMEERPLRGARNTMTPTRSSSLQSNMNSSHRQRSSPLTSSNSNSRVSPTITPERAEENRAIYAYKKWCTQYDKNANDARFENFLQNFRQAEEYTRKTGNKVDLNEFADSSQDEFRAMMQFQDRQDDSNRVLQSLDPWRQRQGLEGTKQYEAAHRRGEERQRAEQEQVRSEQQSRLKAEQERRDFRTRQEEQEAAQDLRTPLRGSPVRGRRGGGPNDYEGVHRNDPETQTRVNLSGAVQSIGRDRPNSVEPIQKTRLDYNDDYKNYRNGEVDRLPELTRDDPDRRTRVSNDHFEAIGGRDVSKLEQDHLDQRARQRARSPSPSGRFEAFGGDNISKLEQDHLDQRARQRARMSDLNKHIEPLGGLPVSKLEQDHLDQRARQRAKGPSSDLNNHIEPMGGDNVSKRERANTLDQRARFESNRSSSPPPDNLDTRTGLNLDGERIQVQGIGRPQPRRPEHFEDDYESHFDEPPVEEKVTRMNPVRPNQMGLADRSKNILNRLIGKKTPPPNQTYMEPDDRDQRAPPDLDDEIKAVGPGTYQARRPVRKPDLDEQIQPVGPLDYKSSISPNRPNRQRVADPYDMPQSSPRREVPDRQSQAKVYKQQAKVADARIRNIYRNWCSEYGRQYDEHRLETFAENLRASEQYEKSTGRPVELNEHSDLTLEEFNDMKRAQKRPARMSQEARLRKEEEARKKAEEEARRLAAENARIRAEAEAKQRAEEEKERREIERVRNAYGNWCAKYGKEFNEEKVNNFAANFYQMEAYQKATGKTIGLNEHSDLSEAEYKQVQIEELAKIEAEKRLKQQAEDLKRKEAEEIEMRSRLEQEAKIQAEVQARENFEANARKKQERMEQSLFDLNAVYSALKQKENIIGSDATFSTNRKYKARHAYTEWCKFYNREFDESRLDVFASNAKKVEKYFEKTGVAMKLNGYADRTAEEYREMQKVKDLAFQNNDSPSTTSPKKSVLEPMSFSDAGKGGSNKADMKRVRDAYTEWCLTHGKEFDEVRFVNFAHNLNQMEQYQKSTGKTVELNEYSDLTMEEYVEMMNSKESSGSGKANPGLIRESGLIRQQGAETDAARAKTRPQLYSPSPAPRGAARAPARAPATDDKQAEYWIQPTYMRGGEDTQAPPGASAGKDDNFLMMEEPNMRHVSIGKDVDEYKDQFPEHVIAAYKDFCKKHGKEYDKSRLGNFQYNYLIAEAYFEKEGTRIELNKYADLSEEEFKEMKESGGMSAPAGAARPSASTSAQRAPPRAKPAANKGPIKKPKITMTSEPIDEAKKFPSPDELYKLKMEQVRREEQEEEDRIIREANEEYLRSQRGEDPADAKAEAESKRQAEAQAQARKRAEAEARIQAEEEARIEAEEAARLSAEEEAEIMAEVKARIKAEARQRAQEEQARLKEKARRKAEEEVKMSAEERLRAKEAAAAKRRAEVEARLRAEAEAKVKAEMQEKRRVEEEAKLKEEEKEKSKAKEEARKRAEVEARLQAHRERERIKAEIEAKRLFEEEARRLEEEAAAMEAEEARRKAEADARLKAEIQGKLRAEEEERQKRGEEARMRAEAEARRMREEALRKTMSATAQLANRNQVFEQGAQFRTSRGGSFPQLDRIDVGSSSSSPPEPPSKSSQYSAKLSGFLKNEEDIENFAAEADELLAEAKLVAQEEEERWGQIKAETAELSEENEIASKEEARWRQIKTETEEWEKIQKSLELEAAARDRERKVADRIRKPGPKGAIDMMGSFKRPQNVTTSTVPTMEVGVAKSPTNNYLQTLANEEKSSARTQTLDKLKDVAPFIHEEDNDTLETVFDGLMYVLGENHTDTIGRASPPNKDTVITPENVPFLSRWTQNPRDRSITGYVRNSPDFDNGTKITISTSRAGAKKGTVVTTPSGQQYKLN